MPKTARFDSKEFHLGFSRTEIECVVHVHASRSMRGSRSRAGNYVQACVSMFVLFDIAISKSGIVRI